MGSTLLTRALSSVQGSDAGTPLDTELEVKQTSDLMEVSNITTTEEFEPPDQEDLRRR
jgi:hypothetical protein